MAYSTPSTWVAGEVLTAAQLNAQLRDNVAFLANPPACRVFHNTTQSIVHGATTTLTFNSEAFDTDSMHSTTVSPSRITFTTAGVYLVTGWLQIAAGTDYSSIMLQLLVGGATVIGASHIGTINSSGVTVQLAVTVLYKAAAGQYVEAQVFQVNGASAARNASANTAFSAAWIGLG